MRPTHLLNGILPCAILRNRLVHRHGCLTRECLLKFPGAPIGDTEWVDANYVTPIGA